MTRAFRAMAILILLSTGVAARSHGQTLPDTTITQAERQGLRMNPDSIWHPTLRFSLPNPGKAFSRNTGLQNALDQQTADHPDIANWVFSDSIGQVLLITATRMGRLDKAGFNDFADGLKRGASHSTVSGEALTWAGTAGEYRATLRHRNGNYAGVRCLGGWQSTRAVIVCVQTITATPTDLEAQRAGFQLTRSQ